MNHSRPVISASARKITKSCFFFLFTCLCSPVLLSQQPESGIDVNDISSYYRIDEAPAGYVSSQFDVARDYGPATLLMHPRKGNRVPPKYVTGKVLQRFKMINPQDEPVSCYYFPGFYFSDTRLYQIRNDRAYPLPVIAPVDKDSVSFRMFTVPAMDSVVILAECFPVRTYTNSLRARIINEHYIMAYITALQDSWNNESLFTYVFCGLLSMMIFFSLASYLMGGRKEFILYTGYALFLGFMLFTKVYYDGRSNYRSFFYESYLDFILQGAGICFYLAFMMRFLETKRNFPFLQRLYIVAISFVLLCLALFSYLHYGTANFTAETMIENYITKGFLLVLIILFLVYAYTKWEFKLLRYLFWGNLFYLIFSALSLIKILAPGKISLPPFFSALILYEIGLLIELVFFLNGLTYKNRKQLIERIQESERLKLDNERKELEKQVAVMAAHQEERERISADMHDELGSGITSIRLMSEIAKNKMKEKTPPEINKISNSANELLNRMNAIIWSMNASNDTVDNLISYFRSYAIEFLDGTAVRCSFIFPEEIPQIEITGDKRRNLFMCLKEALNNVLKHSKATDVHIHISVADNLVIRIRDNGVGFDPTRKENSGNGLKNMRHRMKLIGGTVSLHSSGGTELVFQVPC